MDLLCILLQSQPHCPAGKELAAAHKVHSGHLTVFNTSRPAQVRLETKELLGEGGI